MADRRRAAGHLADRSRRNVGPLEALLGERRRRRVLSLEEAMMVARVRAVLSERYAWTRSRKHVVRLPDLASAVEAAFEMIISNEVYDLVRRAAEDLGGTVVSRANRMLVRGCHQAGLGDEEATLVSRAIRSAPDQRWETAHRGRSSKARRRSRKVVDAA